MSFKAIFLGKASALTKSINQWIYGPELRGRSSMSTSFQAQRIRQSSTGYSVEEARPSGPQKPSRKSSNSSAQNNMTIRTQADGLNELYSAEVVIDCSDRPDQARQEFKDETDVNKILQRYGVDAPTRGQPQYSEIDYDMDLQQSLEAIREAERAVAKLPAELREKYFTWERLLDGAYNGEFKTDLATYQETQRMEKEAAAKEAIAKSNPVT